MMVHQFQGLPLNATLLLGIKETKKWRTQIDKFQTDTEGNSSKTSPILTALATSFISMITSNSSGKRDRNNKTKNNNHKK